jgi:hypothetical protein
MSRSFLAAVLPLLVVVIAAPLAPVLGGCDGDEGGASAGAGSTSAGGGDAPGSGGTTGSAGGGGQGAAGAGGQGGAAAVDPAVFRTPDANAVCGPTPADPCTPGDMAWVAAEYGSTYARADAAAIEAAGVVFRLIELSEREGPSGIDVYVADARGAPLAGIPVAFYFSSAPEASRPDEWYPVKVTGTTEATGRVGFALTADAYIPSCGAGGPHAIWISAPGATPDTTLPSDLADRLGMLGGTNHRHLDLLFQRVEVPGNPVDAVRCPL